MRRGINCLVTLGQFERERIDQTLRKLELALAGEDISRAHRVIHAFELENQEKRRPLEALGLHARAIRLLNGAGIETVEQLRSASTETLLGLQHTTQQTIRLLIDIRNHLERR